MKAQLDVLFERILRSDYYRFEETQGWVRGKTYRVASKMGLPGWPDIDYASQLLAETIAPGPAARVVNVGCGNGLVGAALADLVPQGEVWLVDPNFVATETARRTLEWNGATNGNVLLSERLDAMPGRDLDAVVIALPKGRQVVERWLIEAHRRLAVGGDLYLAGANDAGIKGYSRTLERLFGNMDVVAYRKGHRVVHATKSSAAPPAEITLPVLDAEPSLVVSAGGREYRLFSEPGVFSWAALDQGTAALLDAIKIGEADTVLDLGCGYGILGLVAATMAPRGHSYLVDANVAAVHAASRSLAYNGIENATALASDVISAVRDITFDVVVTNPPFHGGVEAEFITPLAFIAGSAQVLRPGGHLYLVANRFIKYEPYMARVFSPVRSVCEDRQFKVLEGVR